MGNAAIAFENHVDADGVTITCSNELPQTPAQTYLRKGSYEHVLWRFFGSGDSIAVVVDFGEQVDIDTIALMGLSVRAPTLRFRLSTADATGAAGDAHDSNSDGTTIEDFDYLVAVHIIDTVKTGRYLRVDVSKALAESIGLGRLFAGPREVFGENFSPGWSRTAHRRSVDVDGEGGQTFVDRRRGYYRVEATFSFASETDRDEIVEATNLLIVTDGHLDLLWINDIESTNARDFLWGYHEGDQQLILPHDVDELYSVTYSVRQRL